MGSTIRWIDPQPTLIGTRSATGVLGFARVTYGDFTFDVTVRRSTVTGQLYVALGSGVEIADAGRGKAFEAYILKSHAEEVARG